MSTPSMSGQIYNALSEKHGDSVSFMTFLPTAAYFKVHSGNLTVHVHNTYAEDHVNKSFLDDIVEATTSVIGPESKVNIKVDPNYCEINSPFEGEIGIGSSPTEVNPKRKVQPREQDLIIPYINKSRKYWLRHGGNLVAFDRANRVAQIASSKDGDQLPQVCFVGDNGVGKTALLSYIAKSVQKKGGLPGYLEVNDFARTLQQTKGAAMSELGYMYQSNVILVDTLEALPGRGGTQKAVLKLIEYSTSRNTPFVCSFAGDMSSLNKYCEKLARTERRDLASRIGGFEKILLEAPPVGGRQKFIRDLMRKQDGSRKIKDPETLAEHLQLMMPIGFSIRRMEGDLRTAMSHVANNPDFTPADLFNLLGHKKGILMDPKTIINRIAQHSPIRREDILNGSNKGEARYYQQYVAYALQELGYLKPSQIATTMNTTTQQATALLKGFHADVRDPEKKEAILDELKVQILAPHAL